MNCFVSVCDIKKIKYAFGVLNSLKFAVKDSINVEGLITSAGIKNLIHSRKAEIANAFCVDQLLYEGATLVGKTVMDELALSILGENKNFGTPVNPLSPERVPGGSSSGSASAVAQGLVDFAIGTDTGGSVRVPAHNCGIYGFRPSYGMISMSGVLSLSQSFDTVGLFTANLEILIRVFKVLSGLNNENSIEKLEFNYNKIYVIEDLLRLCDNNISNSFIEILNLNNLNYEIISFKNLFPNLNYSLENIKDIYTYLQFIEVWSNYSYWVEHDKPILEDRIVSYLNFSKEIDRENINQANVIRKIFSLNLQKILFDKNYLVFPTAPYFPPKIGEIKINRNQNSYIQDTICFTCLSGLSSCPQISIPININSNCSFGLSVLGAKEQDLLLLNFVKNYFVKENEEKLPHYLLKNNESAKKISTEPDI